MSDPVQAFHSAIWAALGHGPETIEPGQFQRFSTNGRRSDTAGWCRMFPDLRGGVYGDHRAFPGEVFTWSAVDRAAMSRTERAAFARYVLAARLQQKDEQRRRWASNADRIGQLWREGWPLTCGDPVARYLKRRGLDGCLPLPDCLRIHRGLAYWHEGQKLGTFPAMLAPLMAADGRMVAIHRTYLTTDGRKADVPSPKKLTSAAGPVLGGCIPLYRPHRGCIGIAEGIETALAARCASKVPTVAAYSAGALAAWHWPAGLQRVVIFADHDKAGREAADTLRARALAASLRAEVLTPTKEGADWCDVWAEHAAEPTEAGGPA